MCSLVPFDDELLDLGLEHRLRGKVGNAQPLPLENRKPLLNLIHPRAMDRGEMEDKAGMALQPLADFLAMMRGDVVADHVDRRNRRGNLRIKRGQKRDTFPLAFAAMTLSIDPACPGIKGRE